MSVCLCACLTDKYVEMVYNLKKQQHQNLAISKIENRPKLSVLQLEFWLTSSQWSSVAFWLQGWRALSRTSASFLKPAALQSLVGPTLVLDKVRNLWNESVHEVMCLYCTGRQIPQQLHKAPLWSSPKHRSRARCSTEGVFTLGCFTILLPPVWAWCFHSGELLGAKIWHRFM